MPDFKFDIFISYSKHDESWARKLAASLRARAVNPNRIFLDKEYLKPGVKWESTMSNAVVEAKVFVCFWSQNAKDSAWVPEERLKFKSTMDDEEKRDGTSQRKLLMIPLEEVVKEGATDPYGHLQAINDLKETGVYKTGGEPDPNVWSRVVTKVYDAITTETTHTPINLVILAMTRARIDLLNFSDTVKYRDGQPEITFANAIKKMGIITDVSLLDRLDPTMRLVGGDSLADVLRDLGVTTAPTPTVSPADPPEIHIKLANGDSLSTALKKEQIMTVDDLLTWIARHPDVKLPNGTTLDAFLKSRHMNLSDLETLMMRTALRQYYGDSADNWRPFGSPKDEILTIMNDVEGRYNSRLLTIKSSEKPVRWNIPQDFSDDTLFRLGNERTVIVIDPLSLYDRDVSDKLNSLYSSFDNDKALILAFAPFILPAPTSVMRVLVGYKAPKIFDYFFAPEFKAGKVYAKCGPDVGDQADIDRWLLHTLKPQFSTVQKSTRKHASAFTGAGG